MTDEDRRGLDETRRLLYTAVVALEHDREPSDELRGTIMNSLFHHHPGISDFVSLDDAAWCQSIIDKISELLGD